MNISIVGGGPAGLFFAMLMKKRDPSHNITVHEQNPADATYGFGVVFSDVALGFLREADKEFYQAFTANHERCDYLEIVHHNVHVQVHNNHFSRAARIDLLSVLQRNCRALGVNLEFGTRIDDVGKLGGADLVVLADGANSAARKQFEEHFEPSFDARRNKFAWYGTHQLFHPVSLIFKETEHGVFIAHSYQYSRTSSTFLIEVDPETWRRAGLDQKTDEESCKFCEDVFRAELGSNNLLSNRSLWFQATVVRNRRWSYRNMILLGDALRTVHFSLGSGARMAMQDAIALDIAFGQNSNDVQAAFAAFESLRRPASERFQTAAAKSLDWYESVADKMHLDPVDFAYDYMLRTGRVSHEELRLRDQDFITAYERGRRHATAGLA
jgi:anthraniloyl-CoA monooxygenase